MTTYISMTSIFLIWMWVVIQNVCCRNLWQYIFLMPRHFYLLKYDLSLKMKNHSFKDKFLKYKVCVVIKDYNRQFKDQNVKENI